MKRSFGVYLPVGLFQVSSWKKNQTINAIIGQQNKSLRSLAATERTYSKNNNIL
jgi:hypothetical protein